MMKILFLEDDTTIREVTCEYLRMAEHEIEVAIDGKAAIALLEKQSFDIAILDILVPFVNGLEVLEYIQNKKMPVSCIMLSALGDEKTQLKAFEYMTDDYVIKPFSPALLLKRIDAVFRRRQMMQKSDGTAKVDETGLSVDKAMYQAYWNGKSMYLTLTEFLLLESFYDNKSRVFTREELLDKIAPDDFMVSDRVIDAHIKNLRKKCPVPLIRTVIGIGYTFERKE